MRNTQLIKSLAKEALNENGEANEKVIEYALKKFTNKELKIFLRAFKKAYSEKTVIVIYDGRLTQDTKKEVEKMYPEKNIQFIKSEAIGGGLEIRDNDMIINYTVNGRIQNKLMTIQYES